VIAVFQMSNSQLKQIQERLDGLEETMEILADKKILASIKKSLEDIKAGRFKDYRNVKQFKREFESKT
jgi:hypothetical protein